MELKTLCEINGAAGDEREIRKLLLEEAKKRCPEAKIDRAGNVVAFKKGNGKRHLLFCAHMDEVGFIIPDATDEGLLLLRPIGDIDPRAAVSKYVVVGEKKVKGVIGALAIHLQSAEDRKRVLKYRDLYIDIGAKSKDEALGACPRGSYAYFDNDCRPFGSGRVVGKALDDRAGCYNLLRLMEQEFACDVTFVFSCMEQIDRRGAAGAGYGTDADTVLLLDTAEAGDMGDMEEQDRLCICGGGAALSFMDRGALADRELYKELTLLAEKEGIPCQIRQSASGHSDAGAYQRSATGKRACVLSVPCRYPHGPSEVIALSDLDAQYALALAYAHQL